MTGHEVPWLMPVFCYQPWLIILRLCFATYCMTTCCNRHRCHRYRATLAIVFQLVRTGRAHEDCWHLAWCGDAGRWEASQKLRVVAMLSDAICLQPMFFTVIVTISFLNDTTSGWWSRNIRYWWFHSQFLQTRWLMVSNVDESTKQGSEIAISYHIKA